MSHILKALNKAQKEHGIIQPPTDKMNESHNSTESQSERFPSKSFDFHTIFLGVLIILAAMGVYLNYNISLKLASTQNRMAVIANSFNAQDEKLNKLNKLIAQMDNASDGQRKELLASMDKLSANVNEQIKEVNEFSKSQYKELSIAIDEQKKNITDLSGKYEQLNTSVNNYKDVNERYAEQLNTLKKKIAELNLNQLSQ